MSASSRSRSALFSESGAGALSIREGQRGFRLAQAVCAAILDDATCLVPAVRAAAAVGPPG